MADNDQQLPAGLGGVAPAVAPSIPNTPAGTSVINMPNPTPKPQQAPMLTYEQYQAQFTAAQPQVAPSQVPPAPAQNPNPMLTTLQPPAAPGQQPVVQDQPVLPVPPVVPEPPKVEAPAAGTVADLAGALGTDPAIAPGIAYLEAAATQAGLDVTRAFGNAADELDARFIDKAYLIEKVGQAQADQMIKVATASIEYASHQRQALYTECRAVAGDDATWQQAVEIFNKHADPRTKAVISAQFDSLNKDQMLDAATRLVAFAKQSGGVIVNTVQPLGNPGAAQGLSAEAYRIAVGKLPRNAPDSAYEALRVQRAAGQRAGL
jgi:hypothetical protein